MSTSGPDPTQQTAFLISASSGLATITSIYNGSSSALPTQTAMTSESTSPTSQISAAPTTPPSSGPITTGLTPGGMAGIAIGCAAVLAIFLWWLWPKRYRIKKRSDIPTSIAQDIKQSSVTTEVERTDERHLSARVKTV